MSSLLAAALWLAIEAPPGTRWSVACELGGAGGQQRVAFDGDGPADRTLPGKPVECAVTLVAGDSMTVLLGDTSGNRSRTSISGPGSVVRLRKG